MIEEIKMPSMWGYFRVESDGKLHPVYVENEKSSVGLIATSKERIDGLKYLAQACADHFNAPVYYLNFTFCEQLGTILPSKETLQ